jgi:PhzF family phenazine biosynthesis protein
MKLSIYQVDAFASRVFEGNPAAVIQLDQWLPDTLLQAIATENNLSETVYLVTEGEGFRIRWFTPVYEVNLCGHATLASAHTLWQHLGYSGSSITFYSKSGSLVVHQNKESHYTLDFPADQPQVSPLQDVMAKALGQPVLAAYRGKDDLMAILPGQAEVEALRPDFAAIAALDCRGLIATAPGDTLDFVSRCFFPGAGINEDPVTGSAHTLMTPYWAAQTGKDQFEAMQLSARTGKLHCQLKGNRVLLSGQAQTYLIGEIFI